MDECVGIYTFMAPVFFASIVAFWLSFMSPNTKCINIC